MAKHSDGLIRLIGGFKLVKAAILVALGLGALSMLQPDMARHIRSWVHAFGLSSENRYFMKLAMAKDSDLEEVGIASLAYAAVFVVEGFGLLGRRVWAEYLTVLVTMSFIPFEIYELTRGPGWPRALVLAGNVAIVVYLVFRLRADRHWPFRGIRAARGGL